MNLGDSTRYTAGHFDKGFVGFEFNHALINVNGVTFRDEHADNISGFNTFSQVGKCKFSWHK
jgi:hypothetical protein